MIGLASAGCSRAVRRRPNAALVAESKRSGSSSSGGAVASGMSSAAGAGVAVFLGCRRSCNRTSALVFIVASVGNNRHQRGEGQQVRLDPPC